MTDNDIREAIESIKKYNVPPQQHINILLDLAQRYLEVGCPEKKEVGEMRYGGCNPDEDRGYNSALDDYRLWLTKKLESGGIGEIKKGTQTGEDK